MTEKHRPQHSEWKRSEERFQLLVESVKDYGIFMLDPEGYIMSWNAGAERIKGYKPDEIIGSHFSRFYPPEDLAWDKPAYELERAAAEGRFEDEGWRLKKDGSRFWANVVITALWDPETGVLQGFGKVTRDLTERKRADERLRESEEQFRLLIEGVEEYAIFMLDPTGHVATWNSGAEKSKGYTISEIVGEHFERFYTPEDRAAGKPHRLLEIARTKGRVRDQGIRMRKDGSTFHADVLITAVHDSSGRLRGFSKVTRDITDQIRHRENEAARIAAEKANQAKDDFLAVLSHELRTPLTPVVAAANYLIENLPTIPSGEVLENLGLIRRNGLLEAQLIDDLLDHTRISRGKIELRFEAVDAHAVLQDVVGICRTDISLKRQELVLDLAAQEHWIWADPTRIRQVFWNLLNNAVKFTPEDGQIFVRTSDLGPDRLRVEVTDTGIGIEPANIERIFQAFEQGERTVTRQFGGLGLGLAITQSLVNLHRGKISVRSKGHQKGATFSVELASLPHHESARQADPRVLSSAKRSLKILLVDDHDDTRRILTRLLGKEGHAISVAASVQEALAYLTKEPLDVLISDIGLPDGSGHELMKQAQDQQRHIRGIALSGFGMQEDVSRSKQAGFTFHLTKPLDFAQLREHLKTIASEGPLNG